MGTMPAALSFSQAARNSAGGLGRLVGIEAGLLEVGLVVIEAEALHGQREDLHGVPSFLAQGAHLDAGRGELAFHVLDVGIEVDEDVGEALDASARMEHRDVGAGARRGRALDYLVVLRGVGRLGDVVDRDAGVGLLEGRVVRLHRGLRAGGVDFAVLEVPDGERLRGEGGRREQPKRMRDRGSIFFIFNSS